jgi:hypothetical protein
MNVYVVRGGGAQHMVSAETATEAVKFAIGKGAPLLPMYGVVDDAANLYEVHVSGLPSAMQDARVQASR